MSGAIKQQVISTDIDCYNWLISDAFWEQWRDMQAAINQITEPANKKKSQDLLNNLLTLRNAIKREQRARIYRNLAISISSLIAFAGFIGLSIVTGGGFTIGTVISLAVANQLPLLGTLIAATFVPLIPSAFKKLTSMFSRSSQLSIADIISGIEDKTINIKSTQQKQAQPTDIINLKNESLKSQRDIMSFWPSSRKKAIGSAIAKLREAIKISGMTDELLKQAVSKRKAEEIAAEIPKQFNNFADLQQHINKLSNAKLELWLTSPEFAEQLPLMRNRTQDQNKIQELLNNLESLRLACITRDKSKRNMRYYAGFMALAAGALALDLSGLAGSASGAVFATLLGFKITPLLTAGGIAAILSPLALYTAYTNYQTAKSKINEITNKIDSKTNHLQSPESFIAKAKRWLKGDGSKVGNAVRQAICGIDTNMKNSTINTKPGREQRFSKIQGFVKAFDEQSVELTKKADIKGWLDGFINTLKDKNKKKS